MPTPILSDTDVPEAKPVTSLREWLDHLARHGRLAVIRPNVDLRYELAAISKRLDGKQATFFPQPGGHPMSVVSGLILMLRETPLHLGHIRTMAAVTEIGAILYPPVPAFYAKPSSLEEMVDHTLGRVLDLLGLETSAAHRWAGLKAELPLP